MRNFDSIWKHVKIYTTGKGALNIQLLLETGGRSKAKSPRHLAFGSPQHWHDAVKNDPDPSCVSSILSFPDFFLKSSSETQFRRSSCSKCHGYS